MAPQGISDSQLFQTQQPSAPIPLSAEGLAEAEATYIAQGLRLYEARKAQEQWAAETAKKAAEQAREHARETARRVADQARREAETSRAMHAQLHQHLHVFAAADAEASHAFAKK